MATGSDHVAKLDRVLVPAAVPAEHGWTSSFAGPLFDLAPVVLHIQVNLHVGIDEAEVRHSSLDGHDFRRVVVCLSVMCQQRARNQKNAKNQGQRNHQVFHYLRLPKMNDRVRVATSETFPGALHAPAWPGRSRSEEHTSELQSQSNLVCRLLLEKKKKSMQHRLTAARKQQALR